MAGTAARLRAYAGPAWLSRGFRPFFLGAGLVAALAVPAWMLVLTGRIEAPGGLDPLQWHVHELLFGYLPAVMAGFILTAVPNWTGRLPVAGWPLLALFLVWLAGRIAMALPLALPVASTVDVLFLPALAGIVLREIIAGRNHRNLPVVGLILTVGAANAGFLLAAVAGGSTELPTRLGIAAAIMLIMLIGGRIIPSFTRNWLVKQGAASLPAPFAGFDKAALAAGGAALVLWVLLPSGMATVVALILAGILHAVRLARWRGGATAAEPLLLVLHVAYAFVPLGFVLVALAIVSPELVAPSAALHAWTVGTIGMMTLAVMTRATLGHTGGALSAGPMTTLLYLCMITAAVSRIAAGFLPASALALLWIAAAGWGGAMALFVALYGPRLALRRD